MRSVAIYENNPAMTNLAITLSIVDCMARHCILWYGIRVLWPQGTYNSFDEDHWLR